MGEIEGERAFCIFVSVVCGVFSVNDFVHVETSRERCER